MAFIRGSDSPDSLYIWGDREKVTHVVQGPNIIGSIPTGVFRGLLKKYYDGKIREDAMGSEYCKHQKATIKQVWDKGIPLMELSYGKWKVKMWHVTWFYIVNANQI